eukprot:scaffold4285_cov109-Isochrysis_galbana.AAC.4
MLRNSHGSRVRTLAWSSRDKSGLGFTMSSAAQAKLTPTTCCGWGTCPAFVHSRTWIRCRLRGLARALSTAAMRWVGDGAEALPPVLLAHGAELVDQLALSIGQPVHPVLRITGAQLLHPRAEAVGHFGDGAKAPSRAGKGEQVLPRVAKGFICPRELREVGQAVHQMGELAPKGGAQMAGLKPVHLEHRSNQVGQDSRVPMLGWSLEALLQLRPLLLAEVEQHRPRHHPRGQLHVQHVHLACLLDKYLRLALLRLGLFGLPHSQDRGVLLAKQPLLLRLRLLGPRLLLGQREGVFKAHGKVGQNLHCGKCNFSAGCPQLECDAQLAVTAARAALDRDGADGDLGALSVDCARDRTLQAWRHGGGGAGGWLRRRRKKSRKRGAHQGAVSDGWVPVNVLEPRLEPPKELPPGRVVACRIARSACPPEPCGRPSSHRELKDRLGNDGFLRALQHVKYLGPVLLVRGRHRVGARARQPAGRVPGRIQGRVRRRVREPEQSRPFRPVKRHLSVGRVEHALDAVDVGHGDIGCRHVTLHRLLVAKARLVPQLDLAEVADGIVLHPERDFKRVQLGAGRHLRRVAGATDHTDDELVANASSQLHWRALEVVRHPVGRLGHWRGTKRKLVAQPAGLGSAARWGDVPGAVGGEAKVPQGPARAAVALRLHGASMGHLEQGVCRRGQRFDCELVDGDGVARCVDDDEDERGKTLARAQVARAERALALGLELKRVGRTGQQLERQHLLRVGALGVAHAQHLLGPIVGAGGARHAHVGVRPGGHLPHGVSARFRLERLVVQQQLAAPRRLPRAVHARSSGPAKN